MVFASNKQIRMSAVYIQKADQLESSVALRKSGNKLKSFLKSSFIYFKNNFWHLFSFALYFSPNQWFLFNLILIMELSHMC